jgi:hypothetical protein
LAIQSSKPPPSGKDDLGTYGMGLCVDGLGSPIGLSVGIDANSARVMAEEWLHVLSASCVERSAWLIKW